MGLTLTPLPCSSGNRVTMKRPKYKKTSVDECRNKTVIPWPLIRNTYDRTISVMVMMWWMVNITWSWGFRSSQNVWDIILQTYNDICVRCKYLALQLRGPYFHEIDGWYKNTHLGSRKITWAVHKKVATLMIVDQDKSVNLFLVWSFKNFHFDAKN